MEYKLKLKLHIAYEQKNVGSKEKKVNIQNKDNQQLRKVKHAVSLRVSFWFAVFFSSPLRSQNSTISLLKVAKEKKKF